MKSSTFIKFFLQYVEATRLDHVKTLCYNKQHKLQFFHTNNLCVYKSLKKPYIIAKLCILTPANKYNMTS